MIEYISIADERIREIPGPYGKAAVWAGELLWLETTVGFVAVEVLDVKNRVEITAVCGDRSTHWVEKSRLFRRYTKT